MASATDDQLDSIFHALSDRTRRSMLDRLRSGPLTASELAAGTSLSQPTVSKHLKVLETAGLIERERDGTRIYGVLALDPLVRAAVFISRFERSLDSSFDRLAAIVEQPHQPNEGTPS